ncbi:MAG: hypothetical protein EB084_08830 [Proteobacteria bacterium]|nr:hypothetical protein [Pseudomonadota bacterium]
MSTPIAQGSGAPGSLSWADRTSGTYSVSKAALSATMASVPASIDEHLLGVVSAQMHALSSDASLRGMYYLALMLMKQVGDEAVSGFVTSLGEALGGGVAAEASAAAAEASASAAEASAAAAEASAAAELPVEAPPPPDAATSMRVLAAIDQQLEKGAATSAARGTDAATLMESLSNLRADVGTTVSALQMAQAPQGARTGSSEMAGALLVRRV